MKLLWEILETTYIYFCDIIYLFKSLKKCKICDYGTGNKVCMRCKNGRG